MNKKHKFVSIIAASTLFTSFLVGCGNSPSSTSNSSEPTNLSSISANDPTPSQTTSLTDSIPNENLLTREGAPTNLVAVTWEEIEAQSENYKLKMGAYLKDYLTEDALTSYISQNTELYGAETSPAQISSIFSFSSNFSSSLNLGICNYETGSGNFFFGPLQNQGDGLFTIGSIQDETMPYFSFLFERSPDTDISEGFYITILQAGGQIDALYKDLVGQKLFYTNFSFANESIY